MKKDISYFVRFGGLDLVYQKGYGKDTYHAPPTRRGFYAFPLIAQELFLVGSLETTQPAQWPKAPESTYIREKNGEIVTEEEQKEWDEFNWDEHSKKRKKVLRNIRREFKKTKGFIWHHLEEHTDIHEVLGRHGAWVKTSIKEWKKAFMKTSLNNRYGEKGSFDTSIKSISEPWRSGIAGFYSKDHYEVFFDEKV